MDDEWVTVHAGESSKKEPLNFMNLPTEIHLDIVEICILHPAKVWYKENRIRRLLGGSLRELTLVNRYFRELTVPYMFKTICIDDNTHPQAIREDKLFDNMLMMHNVNTSIKLKMTQKFTISLGRTPEPNRAGIENELISTLDFIRPEIQRFVFEKEKTPLPFLKKVKEIWEGWQSFGMPPLIMNTKQLELSAPLGYRFAIEFLTEPYLHIERLWLDVEFEYLDPKSLDLSRFQFLEYVMVRAIPMYKLWAGNMNQFPGFSQRTDNHKLGQLASTLPHLKHFAMCGLLNGPIADVVPLLAPMKSLEQLDITDQQPTCFQQVIDYPKMLHPKENIDKAMCYSQVISDHPANTDRVEAATIFFTALPSLKRICFVRDQVGTMYHAIRDDEGVLERVEDRELITERYRYLLWDNPKAYRCGFPNVLEYSLFDGVDRRDYATLRGDKTFWLNPAYLAGDESVIPEELNWDRCMKEVYGK